MSSPAFTVVIPAYNYGHCVERAVRSVLAQDYPAFQCLVINDGSTDDTLQVLQQLKRSGADFDLVDQANAGLAAVRNRGIEEARHDWLVFLDADDEMVPGALQGFADTIVSHPEAVMVIAAHDSVFQDGRVRRVTPPAIPARAQQALENYLFKKFSIANGACAMHRRGFAHIRYRPEMRQTEDIPVFSHVLAHYPVVSTPVPVARIYKHDQSMRNDIAQAHQIGMTLEQIIFEASGLPEWAGALRARYRGKRALSLVKLCYRGKDYAGVVKYWRQALPAMPLAALSPRYLRRFLVSLVRA
jgi:glycosyltransferase involved in cell wall biosynthesis